MILYIILCVSAGLLFICSCSDSHNSKELQLIYNLCESEPRQALLALDSLDYARLSERDRHFYDLISIKGRDKAYARITSDSLILDIIDYYSANEDDLYLQSLYYAGRVYTRLGDYPTAIDYFKMLLKEMPESPGNMELIGRVQSQIGRLLQELRRNDEAIPYIRKAIYNLKHSGDSVGVVYDNLQLVKVFGEESDIVNAKLHLAEAILYSEPLREEGRAWIQSEKASILVREGKEDSAMIIMKPLTRLLDSLYNTYTYRPTGRFFKDGSDAGYIYAKELSFSRDFNDQIVVTQHMHPLIPKDSAHSFVMAYESRVDDNMNRYESEEEMMQKTRFNYDVHLKARRKAEAEKKRLIMAVCILLLIAAGLAVFFRIRSLKNELRLRMAISILERIEFTSDIENTKLLTGQDSKDRLEYVKRIRALPMVVADKPSLKEELLSRLNAISGDDVCVPEREDELKKSPVMEMLMQMLVDGKGISQGNQEIWKEIEKAVESVSPGFRTKLEVLASGKVTKSEYQVALLAKFGITPKNISTLLYRSKSSITDRRSSLAKKIFGPNANTSSLDRLIARL
ncbi:MAG: tetratricopeptide repeat protein [Muribaculaceae bacterium]|nr:tetratricopeptide repeat protein [Muribaculaceae bacterium]